VVCRGMECGYRAHQSRHSHGPAVNDRGRSGGGTGVRMKRGSDKVYFLADELGELHEPREYPGGA
jgi:hypothetical protein